MADQSPVSSAPAAESPIDADREDGREAILLLAVLCALVVVAAIVFLAIPTSWIGARVEVIYPP